MCLDVLEEFKMPKFAYKIVIKNNKGEYVSPMHGKTIWEIGKVNKDPLRREILYTASVGEPYPTGYHLYAELTGACRYCYPNEAIIKCTYDNVVATGRDMCGAYSWDKIIVAKEVEPTEIVRRERNENGE